MVRFPLFRLLCVAVLALGACKNASEPDVVAAVAVTPPSTSVFPDDTLTLAVALTGASGAVLTGRTVSWSSDNTLVAIVTAEGKVVATGPGSATITATSEGKSGTASVTVPITHPQLTSTVSLMLSGTPHGVSVARSGAFYVSQFHAGTVTRGMVTAGSQTFLGSAAQVGSLPAHVAINPAGTIAYTANQGSSSVSVVDVATNAVTATIPLSGDGYNVLVSPDGTRVFATTASGKVHFIDAATRQVLMAVQVGGGANGLAFSAKNRLLYASSISAGTVTAIDPTTYAIARTYTVGGMAQRIAVTRDGSKLYVASEVAGLQVLDLASGGVTSIPVVGPGVVGLALSPDEQQVWVTNPPAGTIAIVTTSTGSLVTTLAAARPRNIMFDRAGNTAIITDEGGQVLFVR